MRLTTLERRIFESLGDAERAWLLDREAERLAAERSRPFEADEAERFRQMLITSVPELAAELAAATTQAIVEFSEKMLAGDRLEARLQMGVINQEDIAPVFMRLDFAQQEELLGKRLFFDHNEQGVPYWSTPSNEDLWTYINTGVAPWATSD